MWIGTLASQECVPCLVDYIACKVAPRCSRKLSHGTHEHTRLEGMQNHVQAPAQERANKTWQRTCEDARWAMCMKRIHGSAPCHIDRIRSNNSDDGDINMLIIHVKFTLIDTVIVHVSFSLWQYSQHTTYVCSNNDDSIIRIILYIWYNISICMK